MTESPLTTDVKIGDESIKLGQFLKLADLVDSGSEAKPLLAGGMVRVNDVVETRRGRQLVVGDVVAIAAQVREGRELATGGFEAGRGAASHLDQRGVR